MNEPADGAPTPAAGRAPRSRAGTAAASRPAAHLEIGVKHVVLGEALLLGLRQRWRAARGARGVTTAARTRARVLGRPYGAW